MYSLDTVFRDIRTIIASVIIKYDNLAKSKDTLESMKKFDIYKLALSNNDSFLVYESFSEEALTSAGIFGKLLEDCLRDKNNIPEFKKDLVLYYQRQITIREYNELNDYYRMLHGLPNMNETKFVYIDIGIATELDIDYTIPVHLLTSEEIFRLEHVGELDRLRKIHDYKYLNHLGTTKIDLLHARASGNFSILYLTDDINESLYVEFIKIYNQCREYYLSIIYSKEFAKRYRYYDNFIAMMIMTMAIQKMLVNTFKYGIEKEFYDLGSIKLLFDSYSIPFIEELPISYQRLIMKNLNTLLTYKSSDKVLYDICSIMGFDNIDIFKYFLSKEHMKDNNGDPIFIYKEIIDEETGEHKTVLDKEKMFDFKWISVDVRERSIPMALLENSNKENYHSVIEHDPFWIDDSSLRNRLYESEFNYIESKYLKMNIMYNMNNVLFETLYVFRMLTDKKNQTNKITIKIPRFFEKEIPLFNVVIMLTALICRRNKFKGNIIDNLSKTMTIVGFNFEADFKEIRKFIKENERYVDQRVINMIDNINILTLNDVNRMYNQIGMLNLYLTNAMRYSSSIECYNAHKKLFYSLMYCNYNTNLFKKEDGTIATTYMDYLQDIDIDLYAFIVGLEESELSDNIEHILLKISEQVIELKSSYYISSDNNVILNALITIINFFKSYTTDLTSFNILYLFNNPVTDTLRMISKIKHIDRTTHPIKQLDSIFDKIKIITNKMSINERSILLDKLKDFTTEIDLFGDISMTDKLSKDKMSIIDDIIYRQFNDLISSMDCSIRLSNDRIVLRDKLTIKYETM